MRRRIDTNHLHTETPRGAQRGAAMTDQHDASRGVHARARSRSTRAE
jgi:hypothetical protein